MRSEAFKWVWAAVSSAPIALLLGYLYNLSDWQFWALLAAAAWWRKTGPLSD